MGLKFGTKLTRTTMQKGMLVVTSGSNPRALMLEKTIGVIDSLQVGEGYPCLVKFIWSESVDRNTIIPMKPSELRYFGIAKQKNKFCPSSVFDWKPKDDDRTRRVQEELKRELEAFIEHSLPQAVLTELMG